MEKLIKAMKGGHIVFAHVFKDGEEVIIPEHIAHDKLISYVKAENGEWQEEVPAKEKKK